MVIKHEGRTRSARGKPRIKADRGRGSRGRGFGRRGNSHSGYRGTREGKRGGFGRPPSSERLEGGTGPSSQLELPVPQSQVNSEELWDSEDVVPSSQGSVLSAQNLPPSIQSPAHSTQVRQNRNTYAMKCSTSDGCLVHRISLVLMKRAQVGRMSL